MRQAEPSCLNVTSAAMYDGAGPAVMLSTCRRMPVEKECRVKLYIFPIAPNPTKVRLYLSEKAAGGAVIDLPQIMVDLREGEQKRPEHLARNPFGKLPVLELDDGSHLIESLAIIEYLGRLHTGSGLPIRALRRRGDPGGVPPSDAVGRGVSRAPHGAGGTDRVGRGHGAVRTTRAAAVAAAGVGAAFARRRAVKQRSVVETPAFS
jgi:hypothetical protein